MFDVYLITREGPADVIEREVRAALGAAPPPGIALQLRHKRLAPAELLDLGRRLRRITLERGVPLLLNGEPELARAIEADGVHLPEGASASAARAALDNGLVGASCHDANGLAARADEGVDFATLSPVHEVPAKGQPLGLARFAQLVADARLPVSALGGLDASSAPEAVRAGARGVAVIRAVFASPDPAATLQELATAVRLARSTAAAGDRDIMR